MLLRQCSTGSSVCSVFPVTELLEGSAFQPPALRGKIVGLLVAPATKLAQLANAPAGKLARVIQAHASKGEAA